MMLDKSTFADVHDYEGRTPLSYATWINIGRIVKNVLQKRRDAYLPDLTTTNLESDDDHMQELMSKIILQEATLLDTRIWLGMTGLHWAAKHGRDKFIQELLEKGASVDVGERTALVFAVVEGHAEVVRILLAHRASKDAQDSLSRTPLNVCCGRESKGYISNLAGEWSSGRHKKPQLADSVTLRRENRNERNHTNAARRGG